MSAVDVAGPFEPSSVRRLIGALAHVLPPGVTTDWVPAGSGGDGHDPTALPPSPTALLVEGLAEVLGRTAPELGGPGVSVLLEAPGRTLLVHRCGAAGSVVVDTTLDLNLALVRRALRPAADRAAPGTTSSHGPPDPVPSPPVLPRRRPAPHVADFEHRPEGLDVLDRLRLALLSDI